MKKFLSILLILVLVMGLLSVGAAAAGPKVMLSKQNLWVDGERIACEKYNINDENYFKLRDIAYLLNGTGSQFSVNWDQENQVISVVTGEAYEPQNTELDLSFGDKSASAKVSTDKIMINGEFREDLAAYKLEGNNFYRLKDLGKVMGFQVNYDPASNTAIILSKDPGEAPEWLIVAIVMLATPVFCSEIFKFACKPTLFRNFLTLSPFSSLPTAP